MSKAMSRKRNKSVNSPMSSLSIDSDEEVSVEDCEVTKEPSNKDRSHRSVAFSTLSVRQYEIVIGDNPYCKTGLPLSLGTTYTELMPVSIDEYEKIRTSRQTRKQLRKSSHERQLMLQDGYSAAELRQAERRLYRERAANAQFGQYNVIGNSKTFWV